MYIIKTLLILRLPALSCVSCDYLPGCRRANMPWLFYADGSADDVLTDLEITTEFTPGMHLTFTAAKYTLEGSLVSYDVITAGTSFSCCLCTKI